MPIHAQITRGARGNNPDPGVPERDARFGDVDMVNSEVGEGNMDITQDGDPDIFLDLGEVERGE